MIIVKISDVQISRAKILYEFGELKNSISKGESNIFGALGEIIVHDYFKDNGREVDHSPTFDYDMTISGKRIEVKTKRTTVTPKDYYLCSVTDFNTTQGCDYYLFVRIQENKEEGYILGYIDRDEFYQIALFNKSGDKDINGWKFKADCYNIKIEMLNKL